MRWLHREVARQLIALPFALLGLLVPGDGIVRLLAIWDIWAMVYLLLTWLVFRRRDPSALRTIAVASRKRELADRLFASPPEQVSQGAAGMALIATVIAMPRAHALGTSSALVLWICIVAVLTCWLTLQTGFAIVYLGLYTEKGGLEFPGDDDPVMLDFVYLAVAVGTTFGTTDVTVTQSRMRRQVLVHGVIAFFFNTLILAVAVTIMTSYLAVAG